MQALKTIVTPISDEDTRRIAASHRDDLIPAHLSVVMCVGVGLTLMILTYPAIAADKEPPVVKSRVYTLKDAGSNKAGWGEMRPYFTGQTPGTTGVYAAGGTIRPGKSIHGVHRHAEEEYLFISEGSGTWTLGDKEQPAKEGDLLYVEPWVYHGIVNTGSEPLTFLVIKYNSKGVALPPRPDDRPDELEQKPTSGPAPAEATGIYAFVMKDIDGADKPLADYRGKVVLIVNVASRCGFTPQYTGLQKLYEDYRGKGLVVLGVPSNDFGQQEPGTSVEIKEFCSIKFHVTFPMLAKVSVKHGPDQCPLYQYLTRKSANGAFDAKVGWNFNKFLIGRDGRPIKHYDSKVTPADPRLIADIEAALR